jgi:outer membrane protein assembly factor BamB
MPIIRLNRVFVCVVTAFLCYLPALPAKRLPPKPVPPVVSGNVQYSVEGEEGAQYVVASNVTSGQELWRVKVFQTHVRQRLEKDVQWVFITELTLASKQLLVRDEKARCYAVDLTTKRVKHQACREVTAGPKRR